MRIHLIICASMKTWLSQKILLVSIKWCEIYWKPHRFSNASTSRFSQIKLTWTISYADSLCGVCQCWSIFHSIDLYEFYQSICNLLVMIVLIGCVDRWNWRSEINIKCNTDRLTLQSVPTSNNISCNRSRSTLLIDV